MTPYKKINCGMYQLAKDLAKEFDGDIMFKNSDFENVDFGVYDEIITLMYPMHYYGKMLKFNHVKWICYNQGIPPVTKTYFPNFWRRQSMRYINWRNNSTMKGADE
ncbi:MAG: hypothetical protein AABY22_27545, partial [Nanoarchaeota archaeon]